MRCCANASAMAESPATPPEQGIDLPRRDGCHSQGAPAKPAFRATVLLKLLILQVTRRIDSLSLHACGVRVFLMSPASTYWLPKKQLYFLCSYATATEKFGTIAVSLLP